MKFLSAALITLVSLSSFAAPVDVVCVTEIPSTSVNAQMQGQELEVHVIHHFGMKFMPIETGMVTPSDLPLLAQKAKVFEKLGDHYIFHFDPANCNRTDKDLMSCSAGKEVIVNGVKVKPWSFYTKRIHGELDLGAYEIIEVNFNLGINGKVHHFSMQYSKNECQQKAKNRSRLAKYLSKI